MYVLFCNTNTQTARNCALHYTRIPQVITPSHRPQGLPHPRAPPADSRLDPKTDRRSVYGNVKTSHRLSRYDTATLPLNKLAPQHLLVTPTDDGRKNQIAGQPKVPKDPERWGAGVETQKNVRGEIGGWGRVPFNETYAPSLSTIYDGA